MSDEAVNPEDVTDEEEAPKSGKKKLFIIIGAVVALLVIAGAVIFFLNPFGSSVKEGEGEDAAAVVKPDPVFFYSLPEITVNLANVAGRQQYLKLKATLELRDESEVQIIEPFMPRILDAFQVYLRELRTTDIEGSAGIFRLKEELQKRINLAIYPTEVRKVLFEEIIVQ